MKRREEGRREEQSIALGLEREGRREEGWDQGQVGHTERESKTGNIEGKEREMKHQRERMGRHATRRIEMKESTDSREDDRRKDMYRKEGNTNNNWKQEGMKLPVILSSQILKWDSQDTTSVPL